MDAIQQSTQAGRSVEEFAHQAGISRAGLYNVPREHWPEALPFGKRLVIIETPSAWLVRMKSTFGRIPSRTAKK